jgi:oxygen-independent coproporphyrinogen-3 oxidase
VPWFKKHQKMISDAELPGVVERYNQATTIEAELRSLGYAAIGLDHFALAHDALTQAAANRTMRRNFQGYTTDVADALLSFGASAIGEFPGGFVQSARDTLEWSQKIDRNESPVTRGLATTPEDRMRSEVIERLMCDLKVDPTKIASQHGFDPAIFDDVPHKLEAAMTAGIARIDGTLISVPPQHRLFLRTVAAAFDAHFVAAPNRHAKAV